MFFTLEEAAKTLGVSIDQVKELSKQGKLREFRDGVKLMFKADQVEALVPTVPMPFGLRVADHPPASEQDTKPEEFRIFKKGPYQPKTDEIDLRQGIPQDLQIRIKEFVKTGKNPYKYEALNDSGDVISGNIQADSEDEATEKLRTLGFSPRKVIDARKTAIPLADPATGKYTYLYEAMTKDGSELKGEVYADSKIEAIEKVRVLGFSPTKVMENTEEERHDFSSKDNISSLKQEITTTLQSILIAIGLAFVTGFLFGFLPHLLSGK